MKLKLINFVLKLIESWEDRLLDMRWEEMHKEDKKEIRKERNEREKHIKTVTSGTLG